MTHDPTMPVLLNMDCREGLKTLEAGSVSLCLTSPPYWKSRRYGLGSDELGREKDWREYVARLVEYLRPVRALLTEEGNLLLNVRQAAWTGALQDALIVDGWTYQQTYAWTKPNPVPTGRMERRPIEAWEPVMWFSGGPVGWFDPDAGRKPYAPDTIRNGRVHLGSCWHYNRGRTGANPNPLGRHPFNVLEASVGRRSAAHIAPMPTELAQELIAAHCPPEGLVLDPFAGRGTTLKVAWALGRRSVGFELSSAYHTLALKWIHGPLWVPGGGGR